MQGFFHFGSKFNFIKCKKIWTAPPSKKSGNEKNLFVPWDKKKIFFVPRNKKNFFIPTFFTGGCSSNFFMPERVFLAKNINLQNILPRFSEACTSKQKGYFLVFRIENNFVEFNHSDQKEPFLLFSRGFWKTRLQYFANTYHFWGKTSNSMPLKFRLPALSTAFLPPLYPCFFLTIHELWKWKNHYT